MTSKKSAILAIGITILFLIIATIAITLTLSGCKKSIDESSNYTTFEEDIQQYEKERKPYEELRKDIDQVDTTNWKTYKNEEYGFEIKYPEDWGVKEYRDDFDIQIHVARTDYLEEDLDFHDDDISEYIYIIAFDIVQKKSLTNGDHWNSMVCEKEIPSLQFRIDQEVKACESYSQGWRAKHQEYFFTKEDNLRFILEAVYNHQGFNSPIGRKVLETFKFTEENK